MRTAHIWVSKELANYRSGSGLHCARPHSVYLPEIWGWSSSWQSQVLQFQVSVTEYLCLQVRPQLLGLLLVGSLVRLPVNHSHLSLTAQRTINATVSSSAIAESSDSNLQFKLNSPILCSWSNASTKHLCIFWSGNAPMSHQIQSRVRKGSLTWQIVVTLVVLRSYNPWLYLLRHRHDSPSESRRWHSLWVTLNKRGLTLL